jgi:selenium metabolism protein YedF
MPVVFAKKALAEEGSSGVIVLVDNMVSVQNLEKMAKGTGCAFSYEGEGALYKVSITKGANTGAALKEQAASGIEGGEKDLSRGPVVLIGADSMGRGAEDLGKILVKGFIFSLSQLNPPPEAVIFLNGGAHLTKEGANTVPDLKQLEENGSYVYTCGTCANYYKTADSLAVGSIVDMMAITNLLAKASRIITL